MKQTSHMHAGPVGTVTEDSLRIVQAGSNPDGLPRCRWTKQWGPGTCPHAKEAALDTTMWRLLVVPRSFRVLLLLVIVGTYLAMAVKTARMAGELGRSEEMWLLYGLLAPLISFIHAVLLRRAGKHEERTTNDVPPNPPAG